MSSHGDGNFENQRSATDEEIANVQYGFEQHRVKVRRNSLGTGSERLESTEPPRSVWGLALSGGGIRSATFCLGVLQAMARARVPEKRAAVSSDDEKRFFLLPYFDYLSTVSGGGYIGAFFCSLFQEGRLRPYDPSHRYQQEIVVELKELAASNAYKVFQFEPPGRIHGSVQYERQHVGDAPTAWLRENGRYLTPGAGDLFYGTALAIRNWLSLHFVIGMPILFILAFLNIFPVLMTWGVSQTLTHWSVPEGNLSLWWMPAFLLLVWTLPLVLSFWLFYTKQNAETDRPSIFNIAFLGCLITIAAIFLVTLAGGKSIPPNLLLILRLSVLIILCAMAWAIGIAFRPSEELRTVRAFRVNVTRGLARSIMFTLAAGASVAALDVSRLLYQWLSSSSPWFSLTPAAVLGSIVWVTRTVAKLLDERAKKASSISLPLPYLTAILGGAMFCLTVLSWGTLLHWLLAVECFWRCAPVNMWGAGVLLGMAVVLMFITGSFLGFLNLSSFQALYSARLTRAYLGASNGFRFAWSDSIKERESKLSVSEALPGDDMSLGDYFGPNTLAPLHLINVTVNLTVDFAGQLVQRDRKGLPLCIAPGDYRANKPEARFSFILDGVPRSRGEKTRMLSEVDQPLTLGHWIATSGAAFTTGLGRATSLGTSLVCGLANIRLGTWWPANFVKGNGVNQGPVPSKDPWSARLLPTTYYLFNEFAAHFHGLHRDYQYLSDGGHFENTAVYELLRPGRRLELIVLCDCGADPEYRFEDLANLIRLARLDMKLEIEADTGYLRDSRFKGLENVIGVYEDFLTGILKGDDTNHSILADDQCALLFNVFDQDSKPRKLVCVLLVIKPNMITRLNDDVQFYSVTHPAFPNEPTVDQFFNESQFESYRQLGLSTGQLLFGTGRPADKARVGERLESYEPLLWGYLNEQFKKIGKNS